MLLVLFHSTSFAIMAETVSKRAGVNVKLRPIPRHLSSDCGVCLEFSPEDRERMEALLAQSCVEYDRMEPL